METKLQVARALRAVADQLDATTLDAIAAVLSKLVVGKGGTGTSKQLAKGVMVSFDETLDRDVRSTYPYTLTLRVGTKNQKVALTRDQVFTKSKGMWARDQVWRLKPEKVKEFTEQIARILADPRYTP